MGRHYITATVRVEGFHAWEEAPAKVEFLRSRHRHQFKIEATREVSGADRETEFILLGREIKEYLYSEFGDADEDNECVFWCEFGNMSCEMIAERLVNAIGLTVCTVWEDGENGGAYAV